MLLFTSHGRAHVPRDLAAHTSIDHAAETPAADLGLKRKRIDAIWRAVECLYGTGLHPAITLVIRHQGRVVLKRAVGCLSGNGPGESGPQRPLHPDAPICLFSASKSVTAVLVHKLIEQGGLRLEDRVADYIPEFAAHGKGGVTIRQLLAHRAGVPAIPNVTPTPEMLRDWDGAVRMLCEAKPFNTRFEKQAYHALTAGFIVGEVLRRRTRRELPELMREWLAEPLGCQYLTYGLAPELRARAPMHHCTGPRPTWPITAYAKRVVGVTFEDAINASNNEAFQSTVVPAGNIYATADEAGRVFQMLLDGGEYQGRRVLQPETVREAVRPVGRIQLDGTLMMPMRYSAGFMLGENPFGLYGPRTQRAFGHLGFVTVMCWADPARDISVALLNTGKSIAPTGFARLAGVLAAIGRAFPVRKEMAR